VPKFLGLLFVKVNKIYPKIDENIKLHRYLGINLCLGSILPNKVCIKKGKLKYFHSKGVQHES